MVGENLVNGVEKENQKDCVFLGVVYEVEKLKNIYKNAHVVIITSFREGFPLCIMEGMICGAVPISTNVGGISQHVIHGETGFLVDNELIEVDIISDFVNKIVLSKHSLIATGTTGRLIEEALDQPVVKLLSGPLGGDQQIGAMIATGDIDMIFFFFDPMEAQPHDSDVKALLRLAVAWNLPMACDRTTADFIVTSPFMQGEYAYELPDYLNYLNRKL